MNQTKNLADRSYYNYLYYFKSVGRFKSFDQWIDRFSNQRLDYFNSYHLDLALTECIDKYLPYCLHLAIRKNEMRFYAYKEWFDRVIICVFQLFRARKSK